MERLDLTRMRRKEPPFLPVAVLCFLCAGGVTWEAADDAQAANGNMPQGMSTREEEGGPVTSGLASQLAGVKVHWSEWEEAAFERAKAEDKLIFLDLTAVWCHACHVMDQTTYSTPKIIERLNTEFVSIRVDTDRRPDLEARYKNGGWPTTSILLHSGEILFQANFLEPAELEVVLDETQSSYRNDKAELVNRAEQVWRKVRAATRQKAEPKGPINRAIVDQSVMMMRQSFDWRHGGFSDGPKFFDPEAIQFAFLVHHRTRDDEIKRMALKTLDQQLRLFDPVWGGFYRYAEESDWGKPHYEKLLGIQAGTLQNYLEAYQVTRDATYREVAEQLIRYVNEFLADRRRGSFYSSQNAAVLSRHSDGRYVAGEVYFPLSARQRAEIGIPTVDRAVYTSSNGLMITSYLRAFQIMRAPLLEKAALRSLHHLHQTRYKAGAGMAHVVVEGEPEGFGLLEDQVAFARACTEAFLTTGERGYLQKAEHLIADLLQLEDQRAGGFFDRPHDVLDQGLLRYRYKPIAENLRASLLLSDLFYVTAKQEYRERAERTLRFVLDSDEALPVPLVGITVDRFLNYPVHVVVVGSGSKPATRELFEEALHLYAPGKIARLLDPGEEPLSIGDVRFPASEIPQAYICTDRFCSKPIRDPATLEKHLALVLAAGAGRPPTM